MRTAAPRSRGFARGRWRVSSAAAAISSPRPAFVAKYMGDGVLAYFGYLLTHEHDAEHAVQAGLALGCAEAHDRAGVPLQVRVGIATGLVLSWSAT